METTLSTARKPTINSYGFVWSHRADDAVALLQEEGYREFELMLQPPHLSLDPRAPEGRAIRTMVDDNAVKLHALNMPSLDTNLASTFVEMRDYSIDMFRRQIRLASALGAEKLVVAPGRVNPLFPAPAQHLREWLVTAFDELVPLAREEGVVLAVENLPIAALPRATDLVDFLQCMGRPENLAICYDVANAHYVAEDPLEGIQSLKDDLAIIHFSDTRRDQWRHDIIGEGEIGFQPICDLLDEIGWKGPLVIEIIARGEDPMKAIVKSHRALRSERHSFGI